MKSIVLIVTFFFLLSCKKSEDRAEFDVSKVKDINEIVQTIIIEYSLNVSKNGKDSRMLCEELTKLNIFIPEKVKNGVVTVPLPPSSKTISIEDLLHYRKSGFFNTKDSLCLIKQNSNPQKFKIDHVLFEKINNTTVENEIKKKEIGKSYDFYMATIPIFSLDNKKAYIELNHYCGRLCASGKSIYLKKINGKWKIIRSWEKWVS